MAEGRDKGKLEKEERELEKDESGSINYSSR